jgi:uncharacterized protein (DUF927 family)
VSFTFIQHEFTDKVNLKKISINDLNLEDNDIEVWKDLMNHKDVVEESATIAVSKYLFSRNQNKKVKSLLKRALKTKTGWKYAYFIIGSREMLDEKNNKDNINSITSIFEEKLAEKYIR